MKKWTDEEIDNFTEGYLPGGPDCRFGVESRVAAADHIREMQAAVETVGRTFLEKDLRDAVSYLDYHFWNIPLPPKNDPDDNEIGHEW